MEKLSDREIAEKLWGLIDDIDSASDVFKPSDSNKIGYEQFYKYVMSKQSKRHDLLKSDGYDLYTASEWREKNIDKITRESGKGKKG